MPIDWHTGALCNFGADAPRHLATTSWLDYDKIAVPRILDGYRDLGIHATFFAPAWSIVQNPDMFKRIVDEGHEVALHGYFHEAPRLLNSRERERWAMERACELAEEVLGFVPRGWRIPSWGCSEFTPELIAEFGFAYDSSMLSDDVPYVAETIAGRFWELPMDVGMDDFVQYAHNGELDYKMPIKAPQEAVKVWREDLEGMVDVGGFWQADFHPFVSGRPGRWRHLKLFVEEIRDRDDVWLSTLSGIVDHVEQLRQDGEYVPRVERLPFMSAVPEDMARVFGWDTA
jgi:peptidoglycan/xylan/chitin deacetylase (PgdA/CDA1 family)